VKQNVAVESSGNQTGGSGEGDGEVNELAVESGLSGCGIWSQWLWNLTLVAVESGLSGCGIWPQWLWNLDFLAVESGLSGCGICSL
jgi:hypothetical protein